MPRCFEVLRKLACLAFVFSSQAACSTPTYLAIDPSAQNERAGAMSFWYAEDTAGLDADEKPLADLLDRGCAVRKMAPPTTAFFARAVAFANRAIVNPAFRETIRSKTRWELTRDSGAQIMERMRYAGVEINVYMYARDEEHPCKAADVVDGHTNAFTPMPGDRDVHLLFLYEPYVAEEMKKDDVRGFARTLVHEAMHSMGYSHDGLDAGSARYNNAVPTYVGCVVEHWGGKEDQAWIAANCEKADGEQARR